VTTAVTMMNDRNLTSIDTYCKTFFGVNYLIASFIQCFLVMMFVHVCTTLRLKKRTNFETV